MEDLVVMDYVTAEVHKYRISNDEDIHEFLKKNGHRENDCYYLIAEKIRIIEHESI